MNKSQLLNNMSKEFSILFVEDDEEVSKNIAELLEGLFKYVDIAADGKIALSTYETYFYENAKYYDIVISDIHMPHMNGISLSKEIYKINKKQKLLIFSAYDDKKYFIELINIGVSGFLQKPLSFEHLISTLSDVCYELIEERETFRFIKLGEDFLWDAKLSILSQNKELIILTNNEKLLLALLLKNTNQSFTSIDVFEYLYKDDLDREYSKDSVKSLFKRLRKKLPKNLISSTPKLGYSINILTLLDTTHKV